MIRTLLIFCILVAVPFVAMAQNPFKENKAVQDVPISNTDSRFRIVGKLGQPFGAYVKLQGIVINGDDKGPDGGPNIVIQKINDKPTQKLIELKLLSELCAVPSVSLEKLETGKSYQIEGYETGTFIGLTPDDVYKQAGVKGVTAQGTIFQFHSYFVFVKATKIDPIVWSPTDFLDQEAILTGVTENIGNDSYVSGKDWKLLIKRNEKWPEKKLGKSADAWGKSKKTNQKNIYELVNGTARLSKLDDQLGERIVLRGTALKFDDVWKLEYRGDYILIDNIKDSADWSNLSFETVELTGILEPKYTLRKPTVKKIDALLTPEIKICK